MEILHPTSEAHWLDMRAKDITSTQVAALFGLSPYTTEFELYHRKLNNEIVDDFDNRYSKWGNRLESAIAKGIAEDQGWKIRRMEEYIRLPDIKLGASFDFSIQEVIQCADGVDVSDKGILEIKNVFGLVFNDQWVTEGGNIEAPPHIELQVQTQLLVSGRPEAYIGALVSGNKVELLRRVPDLEIQSDITAKVKWFWHSVDNKNEPKPDFEKDAAFIAKLYSHAEPNKVMDVRENPVIGQLADQYTEWGKAEKSAAVEKKKIKSKLLMEIGDAEKCVGEGFSISCGMIAPTTVETYEKKGYRNFRVNRKKKK